LVAGCPVKGRRRRRKSAIVVGAAQAAPPRLRCRALHANAARTCV